MSYIIKLTKDEVKTVLDGRTKISIAKKVDLSRQTVIKVLNGRASCGKSTAYCITKVLNSEAEIADYFDIIVKDKEA